MSRLISASQISQKPPYCNNRRRHSMHVAYQLSASTIFQSSCIQYFISVLCGYTRVYLAFTFVFQNFWKFLISLSDPFRSNFPETNFYTQVNLTHIAGTGSITAVQQSSSSAVIQELLSVEPLQKSKTKKDVCWEMHFKPTVTPSFGFTGGDIHVAYHAQLRFVCR